MERNLQFVFEGEIQGAAAFFVKEFRANSAFSPDGVGTPSGFNEMANIYNFYKVLELKFYYRVVSNETATPQRFAVIVRDVQPSTVITTFNNATAAMEVSPTTKTNSVGALSGMSRFESIEYKIDIGSIIGNRLEYLADTDYRGLVTGQPNQVVWLAFVMTSPNTSLNLSAGAFVEVFLTLRTLFYSTKVVEI
jgi:hypothetical protein